MRSITLVTGGGDRDTMFVLNRCVETLSDIKLLATATKPDELADIIEKHRPDAVICDERFGITHGITAIALCGDRLGDDLPLFLITVSEPRDLFRVIAAEMDVVIVPKPYDPTKLFKYIDGAVRGELTTPVGIRASMEERLAKIFRSCGLDPESPGGVYLRAAAFIAYENPARPNRPVKNLYPEVAELYAVSCHRVERSMGIALRRMKSSCAAYFDGVVPGTPAELALRLAELLIREYGR